MYETATELTDLQALLDRSIAGANDHLKSIIEPGRRTMTAVEVAAELVDVVCVLNVASVTARGEPRLSAVDGHFLHGHFYFSTLASATKARHLRVRPAVSVSYTPRDGLGIWAHGAVTFVAAGTSEWQGFDEQATLMYGQSITTFGDSVVVVRVDPTWMVGFAMTAAEQLEIADSLAERARRLAERKDMA
jgi:hypothetical protein